MRLLWKWLLRLVVMTALLVLALLSPVAYTEAACRPSEATNSYAAILPPEHHRPESRTLLTYPEWHIVHAYDDYAEVIRTGDPHDFGYVRAITDFWSTLCTLSADSGPHGGFPSETKLMVYTIGVSFNAELLAKAAYEETLGRIATWVRGPKHAPLDALSASQARAYASFLQQTPWYKWDFSRANTELTAAATNTFRDRERHFALGIENAVKASYAGVIEQAVAGVGADALTLRMIVADLPRGSLAQYAGVKFIAERAEGFEIETPRYRVLTHLLQDMAKNGANFVEIAGNDDILFTAITKDAAQSLASFRRQGYGDMRHLMLVKVPDLADTLRDLANGPMTLEHIHDF